LKLFLDTSVLVKYYYPETDSEQVEEAILQAEQIYICSLAVVELASALMRKYRMKELTNADKSIIWEAFLSDLKAENVEVISLTDEDFFSASELILRHGNRDSLRALDSLQLAAALKVKGAVFMTADKDLQKVATTVGL